MIKELIFEAPINGLSLGNVSLNFLLELYKKGIKVHYSGIGQPDAGNYKLDQDFINWLQSSANTFLRNYKRDLPTLKNWHLNGSQHFPTNYRYLTTYHECDAVTPEEKNIVSNINKVFFCGNYSPKVFNDIGLSVDTFNLGFDSNSFFKLDKKYFDDGRIQWFLGGKAERRKATFDILRIWANKFGKKQGESYKSGEQIHFLNCCIINPFYDIKVQEQQLAQTLGGQRYINIQFFPFLDREKYNDLYNASDIDLTGLALAESWNLPAFNMTALGKWSIVLNATGHKTWATKDNSILINPSGKTSIVDGIHFHPNTPFNIGNCYTWDEKDVINAMDIAVKKAKTPNPEGEKLKEQFTYSKTVDYILEKIEGNLNENS